MDTQTQTKKTLNPFHRWIVLKTSEETQKIITFCKQKGWDTAYLGKAPLPHLPARKGDWLIVPAHLDTSALPERAMARIRSIYTAGFRPQGFVLVHEAPKLLPANITERPDQTPASVIAPEVILKIRSTLKIFGGALGTIALATGAVALAILALSILLPVFLITVAVVIDPILVVVTKDNNWIEIDRWWN
ncbi:MAG: hypothetical protein PVF83_14055 [Anaerolineales bacterium]|jgi:hypothetical protein